MPLVDAIIEAFGGLAETDGTHLSKFYTCLKQRDGESPTTFQGIEISDSGLLRSSFQSARVEFVTKLTENLRNRFLPHSPVLFLHFQF